MSNDVAEFGVNTEAEVTVKKQEGSTDGNYKTSLDDSGFKLDFTKDSLLNGIILAEVLGRPKYFRKGRC